MHSCAPSCMLTTMVSDVQQQKLQVLYNQPTMLQGSGTCFFSPLGLRRSTERGD